MLRLQRPRPIRVNRAHDSGRRPRGPTMMDPDPYPCQPLNRPCDNPPHINGQHRCRCVRNGGPPVIRTVTPDLHDTREPGQTVWLDHTEAKVWLVQKPNGPYRGLKKYTHINNSQNNVRQLGMAEPYRLGTCAITVETRSYRTINRVCTVTNSVRISGNGHKRPWAATADFGHIGCRGRTNTAHGHAMAAHGHSNEKGRRVAPAARV